MPLIEGLDAVRPGTRMLDQSQIGRVLTGDAEALRATLAERIEPERDDD